jgi:high-affinity Fe2+/Pb2+ permease
LNTKIKLKLLYVFYPLITVYLIILFIISSGLTKFLLLAMIISFSILCGLSYKSIKDSSEENNELYIIPQRFTFLSIFYPLILASILFFTKFNYYAMGIGFAMGIVFYILIFRYMKIQATPYLHSN